MMGGGMMGGGMMGGGMMGGGMMGGGMMGPTLFPPFLPPKLKLGKGGLGGMMGGMGMGGMGGTMGGMGGTMGGGSGGKGGMSMPILVPYPFPPGWFGKKTTTPSSKKSTTPSTGSKAPTIIILGPLLPPLFPPQCQGPVGCSPIIPTESPIIVNPLDSRIQPRPRGLNGLLNSFGVPTYHNQVLGQQTLAREPPRKLSFYINCKIGVNDIQINVG